MRLKAAFLLIIFSLNIFVGFACAVGVDMSFNTRHHHEEATEIHIHADGKKHIHRKGKSKIHVHADGKKHRHETAGCRHHACNDKKGDCCNDKVVKIIQDDKALPHVAKLLSPSFLTAFVAVYYSLDTFNTARLNTPNQYFVLGHHPPIPDIRIAIRSF